MKISLYYLEMLSQTFSWFSLDHLIIFLELYIYNQSKKILIRIPPCNLYMKDTVNISDVDPFSL